MAERKHFLYQLVQVNSGEPCVRWCALLRTDTGDCLNIPRIHWRRDGAREQKEIDIGVTVWQVAGIV